MACLKHQTLALIFLLLIKSNLAIELGSDLQGITSASASGGKRCRAQRCKQLQGNFRYDYPNPLNKNGSPPLRQAGDHR